ncbi:hypothetical protein GCM10007170_28370 [Arthrobacter liuii]|uniref:Uncharacterized protein n=1 Tax=Arthrobacter liuii TaxID=1476996 RepID=A0ABQ2AXG9_9MICC|nr:hypothetical protein GCM10007170_28370 [Arthrobacter liuii]
MGLRSFFRNRRTGSDDTTFAAAAAEDSAGPEPLTPAQLAELQTAWVALAKAAKDSGVGDVHACSRNGRPWQDNPAAVRSLAATLRHLREEGTTPTPSKDD